MKFGDFSWNLSGINIVFFFSKFELAFALPALFHNQALFFVYVFCWNNEYMLDNIVFKSKRFRKNLYWLF